jgi:hypothetical protein
MNSPLPAVLWTAFSNPVITMSSSTACTLKRKRSVEHTLIDLETALRQLTMLKKELGLEWWATTANDRKSIINQVNTLQAILLSPKKLVCVWVIFILLGILPNPFGFQKVNFSRLNEHHLRKLGIVRKQMNFDCDRLVALIGNMAQKTKDKINLLKDQLVEVYTQVNM